MSRIPLEVGGGEDEMIGPAEVKEAEMEISNGIELGTLREIRTKSGKKRNRTKLGGKARGLVGTVLRDEAWREASREIR